MHKRKRILCVDDERSVLKALERVFMDEEYEIITAVSGEEGLVLLDTWEPVQVVVSDFRMPGMSGMDFLKEVCRCWPDTVRIVLSGYAEAGASIDTMYEGTIYKYITKPWNDDELRITISSALKHYCFKNSTPVPTEKQQAGNDTTTRNTPWPGIVKQDSSA